MFLNVLFTIDGKLFIVIYGLFGKEIEIEPCERGI